MTVSELMDALKKMPPNLEVITEGCDCDGDVTEVVHDTENAIVYLKRK